MYTFSSDAYKPSNTDDVILSHEQKHGILSFLNQILILI